MSSDVDVLQVTDHEKQFNLDATEMCIWDLKHYREWNNF